MQSLSKELYFHKVFTKSHCLVLCDTLIPDCLCVSSYFRQNPGTILYWSQCEDPHWIHRTGLLVSLSWRANFKINSGRAKGNSVPSWSDTYAYIMWTLYQKCQNPIYVLLKTNMYMKPTTQTKFHIHCLSKFIPPPDIPGNQDPYTCLKLDWS